MTKLLIPLAGALLASSAANAQGVVVVGEPAPSQTVSYADLNIASESGKTRLQHRIRAAARSLCLENNVDSLETELTRRACFESAVGDGYRQMDVAIAARASGAPLAAATLVIRGK